MQFKLFNEIINTQIRTYKKKVIIASMVNTLKLSIQMKDNFYLGLQFCKNFNIVFNESYCTKCVISIVLFTSLLVSDLNVGFLNHSKNYLL